MILHSISDSTKHRRFKQFLIILSGILFVSAIIIDWMLAILGVFFLIIWVRWMWPRFPGAPGAVAVRLSGQGGTRIAD